MEKVKKILKKLSYNGYIIKTIQFLHLRTTVRKIYYFWNKPKNNLLPVSMSGVDTQFYIRNPDELRLAESVSGEQGERPVIESLMESIRTGDVVYDVGANIGIYAILLAKKVGGSGRVIAFEPEKESCERLADNTKVNGLNNITIVKKALGQENKSAELYIGETTGNFSLVKSYEKDIGSQNIEIVSGDEFVKSQNLPIPKVVKIDVEGYEYSVLAGLKNTLTNPDCKIVCCEIHPGLFPEGITEEKVLQLITSLGFIDIKTFKRAFSAYHVIARKP